MLCAVPRRSRGFVLVWGLLASLAGDGRAALPPDLPLPPLEQLALEGVPWLVDEAHRAPLLAAAPEQRAAAVAALLVDPDPATAENELLEAVRRRRALMLGESLTTGDARARLLFLNGEPDRREPIDCSTTFEPLEVWTYGTLRAVLYRASGSGPFRLWVPGLGKRVLYSRAMGDAMDDWAQGKGPGGRLDRIACKAAQAVDLATGLDGLYTPLPGAAGASALQALVDPPADLGAWARAAAGESLLPTPVLPSEPFAVSFPRRHGQRIEARMVVTLPPSAPVVPAVEKGPQETERRELRLVVEGVVERDGALFESFRVRFTIPAPAAVGPAAPTSPLVLAVTRPLRPGPYVVRLRVSDEVGGGQALVGGTMEVPAEPVVLPTDLALDDAPRPPGELAPAAFDLVGEALTLFVPPRDVVFDSVRAQAIVRETSIRKVRFLLDGKEQLSRVAPPWSVEVKLPRTPREQLLRAEGYDRAGALVAADEVVLNRLTGKLDVRIVSPPAWKRLVGEVMARVELTVPEERRVEAVEFRVNDQLQARLEHPAWEAKLKVPNEALTYLTASAELDDGERAEDVRFLTAPGEMARVEVSMVELYTAVTDPAGELVRGLGADDFEVREDGRKQTLESATLVEDLPLVVGIALDVSGSMEQALGEAQRAAASFLASLVRQRDRCFAVAFSSRPTLVVPRTPDAAMAAHALGELRAAGATSLYDALVLSLYYMRGTEARRALVVLSDGADTDSILSFDEAMDYARESGVMIYTVGLQTEALDIATRSKLSKLASATGGRSFVVSKATELAGVYEQIERELRSQYLLAYAPDRGASGGGFRRVEVKVKARGATARTIPGYSP